MSVSTRVRARRAGRTGLVVATMVALGLGMSACGGTSTAGQDGGSSASSSDDRSAALVKYAQCMRSHGVPSFPDPKGGRLTVKARRGGPLDPNNPTFQKAQKACKSMEPPGIEKSSGGNSKQEAQLLKFVSCMRKNGVPKFPDPVNGRIQINPGAGVDPESAQFKSAQAKCRKLMPGGVAPGP